MNVNNSRDILIVDSFSRGISSLLSESLRKEMIVNLEPEPQHYQTAGGYYGVNVPGADERRKKRKAQKKARRLNRK